jgi:hypothetical protein
VGVQWLGNKVTVEYGISCAEATVCWLYENILLRATRLIWVFPFSCCYIVINKIYGQYLCIWFIYSIIYCSALSIFLVRFRFWCKYYFV